LKVSDAILSEALDPVHFVAIRKITGGPSPEVVRAEIARVREECVAMSNWLATKQQQEKVFPAKIDSAKSAVMGTTR
jgi:argininosuccinate lyase